MKATPIGQNKMNLRLDEQLLAEGRGGKRNNQLDGEPLRRNSTNQIDLRLRHTEYCVNDFAHRATSGIDRLSMALANPPIDLNLRLIEAAPSALLWSILGMVGNERELGSLVALRDTTLPKLIPVEMCVGALIRHEAGITK